MNEEEKEWWWSSFLCWSGQLRADGCPARQSKVQQRLPSVDDMESPARQRQAGTNTWGLSASTGGAEGPPEPNRAPHRRGLDSAASAAGPRLPGPDGVHHSTTAVSPADARLPLGGPAARRVSAECRAL